MRTRLACLLLLALLPACGGAAEPAAAPSPTASPTPSPTPAATAFDPAEVEAALLVAADLPAGYAVPDPRDFPAPEPRTSVQLCTAEGAQPPPVPPAPRRLFQGPAPFDAVNQSVAVLPDERTAVAVLAAVQRHAAACERESTVVYRAITPAPTQTTTRADVVPVSSGAWKGVRQSSSDTYTGRKTQRWQTQTAVLRRGNALLVLEVSGESAPPDLGAVLTKAVARLDATL